MFLALAPSLSALVLALAAFLAVVSSSSRAHSRFNSCTRVGTPRGANIFALLEGARLDARDFLDGHAALRELEAALGALGKARRDRRRGYGNDDER